MKARDIRVGDTVKLVGDWRKVEAVLDGPPESTSSCFTRPDNVWLQFKGLGGTYAILADEAVTAKRD